MNVILELPLEGEIGAIGIVGSGGGAGSSGSAGIGRRIVELYGVEHFVGVMPLRRTPDRSRPRWWRRIRQEQRKRLPQSAPTARVDERVERAAA